MKYAGLVLASFVGSATLGVVPLLGAAAEPAYTDTLCPRAVPKVTTFNNDAMAKSYAKLVDDAQAVVNAYHNCMTDARATTGLSLEPMVNYNQTRTAQYMIVLGRLQAATGDLAAAIDSLKRARALATDVAEWLPSVGEAGSAPNPPPSGAGRMGMGMGSMGSMPNTPVDTSAAHGTGSHQPSRYRDAALQIQAAADGALAKLGAVASPTPEPTTR
jgi:hypothetical protein